MNFKYIPHIPWDMPVLKKGQMVVDIELFA